MTHDHFAVGLVLASLWLVPAFAQREPAEKVWAVFAYTLNGDSSPSILHDPKTLTPYGAGQLYSAGSSFRERYIAFQEDENSRIQNISPYELDAIDVGISSTDDHPAIASAQAFMQGLYPPLDISGDNEIDDPTAFNASSYQYPRVVTLGPADLGFERIAGHCECPMYEASRKA